MHRSQNLAAYFTGGDLLQFPARGLADDIGERLPIIQ